MLLAAACLAAVVAAPAADASCIRSTPAELRARADVVFDGVALDGRTRSGVQRFRVARYLKGRGPGIVRVQTGTTTTSTTSVSIDVRRGQRWRIFADGRASSVLRTSLCAGSRKL